MVIDIDAGSADGLHRWRRRILDTVVLHRVVKVLQRAYCIGAGQQYWQHRAAGPASVGIERTVPNFRPMLWHLALSTARASSREMPQAASEREEAARAATRRARSYGHLSNVFGDGSP